MGGNLTWISAHRIFVGNIKVKSEDFFVPLRRF